MTRRKSNKTGLSAIGVASLCLIPALTLAAVAYFANDWETRFAFSGGLHKQCKATHKAGGFVRNTMSLAEMSAISTWSKEVTKYGLDYNFWSNAEKKLLRCKKIKGTRFINCVVWAAPCRNVYKDPVHTAIAQKKQSSHKP